MKANFYALIFILLFLIGASGCGTVREVSDNILGTSLAGLERHKNEGISQVVSYSPREAFDKVIVALGKLKADIMKVDVERLSIFAVVATQTMLEDTEAVFPSDRADVGIFFDAQNHETLVTVVSYSLPVRRLAAKELFAALTQNQ